MTSSICSEVQITSWEAHICSDGQDIENRKLIDILRGQLKKPVLWKCLHKNITLNDRHPKNFGFDAKRLMVSKIFYLKYYVKLLLGKRAGNSW